MVELPLQMHKRMHEDRASLLKLNDVGEVDVVAKKTNPQININTRTSRSSSCHKDHAGIRVVGEENFHEDAGKGNFQEAVCAIAAKSCTQVEYHASEAIKGADRVKSICKAADDSSLHLIRDEDRVVSVSVICPELQVNVHPHMPVWSNLSKKEAKLEELSSVDVLHRQDVVLASCMSMEEGEALELNFVDHLNPTIVRETTLFEDKNLINIASEGHLQLLECPELNCPSPADSLSVRLVASSNKWTTVFLAEDHVGHGSTNHRGREADVKEVDRRVKYSGESSERKGAVHMNNDELDGVLTPSWRLGKKQTNYGRPRTVKKCPGLTTYRHGFNKADIECLVKAVEKFGAGRWREVKENYFSLSRHQSAVHLKDKWRSLVHSAKLPPEHRRGVSLDSGLIKRILAIHKQEKLLD